MELIQKTGIANAIAAQLGGMKGNRNAISETIEKNVRSKIIKEHLNDPAFYEKMSALLDEIIAAERNQIAETGEYNLDGLFIRLAHAVKAIKAKRVVLDSVEALFSGIEEA